MIIDKCPETDILMKIAWRDCLLWSISSTEPEFITRFQEETGLHFLFAKSPIEAMIDDATGANTEIVGKYIDWFNANVWGGVADGMRMIL